MLNQKNSYFVFSRDTSHSLNKWTHDFSHAAKLVACLLNLTFFNLLLVICSGSTTQGIYANSAKA